MARYVTEVTAPTNINKAFAYLCHFSSAAEWDPSVVRSEDLTSGPAQLESKFLIVTKFLGREVPLEYEVIDIDVPNKIVLKAEDKSIRSIDTITFTPQAGNDNATTVRYDALLELQKPSRVGDFVLGIVFKRLGNKAAAGLRRELGRLATTSAQ